MKLKGQKSHTTMSASAVRETARSTAAEAIDMQKEEFRSLAVMADWDNTDGVYITMSE
jgi:isoleucyl-tRNA synthetase